jgi:hypothetical protein
MTRRGGDRSAAAPKYVATTHALGLWLRTHKYTVKLTFKGHGDGVKGQISRYSSRLPKRLYYASAEAESAEAAR